MAEQPDLITLTNPRSPAAEAYRTLRTNLTFAALDKPIETLVVTSAAPGEGKSTVLANLAVTMAQGERRTILVDADLRRPGLHEVFGIANDRGLTTMIVEGAALEDPPLINAGVDNLWLVPSGPLPPNPADILGSRKMEEVIAALIGMGWFWLGWPFWAVMITIFGLRHPKPLDNITPLSRTDRILALVALLILILTFVPAPFGAVRF